MAAGGDGKIYDNRPFIGLMIAISIIGGGSVFLWSWHQKRSHGYEAGSICARALDNRTDFWLVFFTFPEYDPKDPQAYSRKVAEAAVKAETADRNEFVSIVEKVRFAERTKIIREGYICLPPGADWVSTAFLAYQADLKARLKADPQLCRTSFEADVMNHLVSKYPCSKA